MEYRNLTMQEKIGQVRKYRPYREERHYMAVYLAALRKDNHQTIDEYESFGNDPRPLLSFMRMNGKRK